MNTNQFYFQRCPHDKQNPYVMVSRQMAQDKSISPKAKGVLLYLLSLPSDWKIYHSQLQEALGIGEDYLNSAMDELIESGYAERTRERIKGVFQPYKYLIREFKKCLPNGISQPGSSSLGNPVLQSIESRQSKQQQASPVSAAVSFESSNSKEQKPKIWPALESIAIDIKDKIQITRSYAENVVIYAITWATHPLTVINKTLAAAIKWACKARPTIPQKKVDIEEINRSYAKKYEGEKSGNVFIEACKESVQIVNGTHVIGIKYAVKSFMEEFRNALTKNNFKLVEA